MESWDDQGITADPGRVHTEGRIVRSRLEEARADVAALLCVRPRQVVFTSGATEAINAAVWGVTHGDRGPAALAPIEHSAVGDASGRSGPVMTISVDGLGRIEPDAVDAAMDRSLEDLGRLPALVHCQWANHEVGTIQPISEIVERCHRRAVPIHVDAAAAVGHVPTDLGALGADLVSVSSHKLGGPPGAGALVLRRGLRIDSFIVGGEQERARRGGLENVRAAVGFGAAAAELASSPVLGAEHASCLAWTEEMARAAMAVEGVDRLGDPRHRLPHLLCLGIGGVEAEPVLLGLDQAGIAAHSGSSCSSESLEPSPVLAAMGADAERSLRLSVGWSTVDADIEAFVAVFPRVVAELRSLRT